VSSIFTLEKHIRRASFSSFIKIWFYCTLMIDLKVRSFGHFKYFTSFLHRLRGMFMICTFHKSLGQVS